MTAPPIKRPVWTCQSKQRWSDEFAARAGAMLALERPGNPLNRLWVYRCKECHGWHLTSNSSGKANLVTIENPIHTKVRAALT